MHPSREMPLEMGGPKQSDPMALTGSRRVRRRSPLPGVVLFDGDEMHTEKLYADVSPLVPFMPWLVEA